MDIKNKLNPGPNEKELLSVINLIKLGQFTQAQDEAAHTATLRSLASSW